MVMETTEGPRRISGQVFTMQFFARRKAKKKKSLHDMIWLQYKINISLGQKTETQIFVRSWFIRHVGQVMGSLHSVRRWESAPETVQAHNLKWRLSSPSCCLLWKHAGLMWSWVARHVVSMWDMKSDIHVSGHGQMAGQIKCSPRKCETYYLGVGNGMPRINGLNSELVNSRFRKRLCQKVEGD